MCPERRTRGREGAGAAARGRKGARATGREVDSVRVMAGGRGTVVAARERAGLQEGRRIRGDGDRSDSAKMPTGKGGIPIEMEKRGG